MNSSFNSPKDPRNPVETADFSSMEQVGEFEILKMFLTEVIQGVLIVNGAGEAIYSNHYARDLLHQLTPVSDRSSAHTVGNTVGNTVGIPEEIRYLCRCLVQSRDCFPQQYWAIESQIIIPQKADLQVQVRWLQMTPYPQDCLLLLIRDRNRPAQQFLLEEAKKYHLTARETEIWLLHRAHYTYKQIAADLGITPNTVKKHMKQIHAKQKAFAAAARPWP